MNKYAKISGAKFIITTGDNFYPSGVKNVSDPHWKSSFEDVYLKDSLPMKWYPVLGNHDYLSNPQAEIDYSMTSDRWNLPSRYYTFKINIDSTHSVLFVFTDTSPFLNSYYTNPPIMPDLAQQDTALQLQWLTSALSTADNTWKIVVGHHPVYSVGLHGNTRELTELFKPVLNNKKVDFYIAGHDHDLEHLKPPNETVNYLVSGGGAESYPILSNANSLFAMSSPGFLVMTIYPERSESYFYNDKGELVYHYSHKKLP